LQQRLPIEYERGVPLPISTADDREWVCSLLVRIHRKLEIHRCLAFKRHLLAQADQGGDAVKQGGRRWSSAGS